MASLVSIILISSPVVAYGQTVTAMWDASPPSEQVTAYEVCIGTASMSCNVQLASVNNAQTTYTFTPAGGVNHFVAVRAINPSGTGSYSTESMFSIPSFTQPANQSNPLNVAITPLNMLVSDPDSSAKNYTHTGLPTGLSINSATGQITGTPSATGTFNVTIFLNDSLVTVSRSFAWTITTSSADTTAPALAISSHTNNQTVSNASVTIAGTATDSGRGGNGVSSVTVNGQSATGGVVSGNATASWSRALTLSQGANTIAVQATDSRGNVATQSITLNYTVSPPPPAPVASVALSSSLATPQNTGTAITFTAVGAGGVAPRQYKFLVRQGGGANQLVQDWSTLATYTWAPSVAGSYTMTVWARSAGATADAAQASAQVAYVINTPPPASVTSVTLTSNLASPQATGRAIVFTANASGGAAPRQYKFLVQQAGGATQVAQNWSVATSYTWTPAAAGTYTVTAWARSAGVTADTAQASAQMVYVVNTPPPASVTSATLRSNIPSPQTAGVPVTLYATGIGGVGPRQYKFFVQPAGGGTQVVQNWSTDANHIWTPTTAGSYTLIVWARSAGVIIDAAQASAQLAHVVRTPSGPLAITGLTPSVASPQAAGTPVTFTAAASGGTAPYSFKWWLFDGTTWTMIRDWSATATYSWTPVVGGNYRIGIWVRDASTTADVSIVNRSIPYSATGAAPAPPPAPVPSPTPTPGAVTITGLTSNLASPQASGTPVTFTAAATGGQAPHQFKWWVYNGNSWTMVRDWNSSTTYTWTPTSARAYRIGIWARDASTTVDVSNVNLSVPFTVSGGAAPSPAPPPPAPSPSPAGPLAVTSLTSNLRSPEVAGTAVTFTAVANGATAPYQYKWWLHDGVNWTVAANWTRSNTFAWTPLASGSYRIGVWVRDSTTTADVGNVNLSTPFVVSPASGLSVATIGLSTPVPVAGSAVGLTALAAGGIAPYSFKWWVFDGTRWTTLRDWGPSTFTWTPPRGGNYRIGVWVRSAGSTDNSGSENLSIPVVVQ